MHNDVTLNERMAQLARDRVPHARALVVRTERPTSARPGDRALITADGTIDGFVGGQCVVEQVRSAALESLVTGEPILLRILPGDHAPFPDSSGALVAVNSCLSGGAIEVYVEPVLPPSVIHVVGATPIAHAIRRQAQLLGYEVSSGGSGADSADADPGGAIAAVVSTHGVDEEVALRRALDAGVPYVGLVASVRRGTAVLEGMELTEEQRLRLHTPVGLPIGAETPAEIALSVMADVVSQVRQRHLSAQSDAPSEAAAQQEVDPVCGMTVVVTPTTVTATVDDRQWWFCCAGCRDKFVLDPTAYHQDSSGETARGAGQAAS